MVDVQTEDGSIKFRLVSVNYQILAVTHTVEDLTVIGLVEIIATLTS